MSLKSLAFLAFVLWIVWRLFFKPRLPLLAPPLPRGLSGWFWGHEAAAFCENAGDYFGRWFDVFGPALKIRGALGYGEILVLADPEAIAHIYIKRTFDYPHSPVFRPLIERLLGRSLVWVEEQDEHKRLRTTLGPLFSADAVKDMEPDITEAATRLHQKLTEHVITHDRNTTINILDWTWLATLDVIGRVGFSHDFLCGDSQDAKAIAKAWKDQVQVGMDLPGLFALVLLRALPFISNLPVEAIQKQGDIKVLVKQLAKEIVTRGPQNTGRDLLSVLLRENAKQGRPETADELLDHICTFVMVGHETVAGAMNYTIWELARHPDVQKKLREESLAFGGQPTFEDFQTKLPYLDAVLKESLRLHPPSAHTEKIAARDDVIPLSMPVIGENGTVIKSIPVKAGQLISIPSIAVARLNSTWGDGSTYRPERWLAPNQLPPESKMQKGWANTFAFSEGPRNCIGFRMAIYEYKIILTTLIRHFVFHDTGAEIQHIFSATLQPRVIGKEKEGPALPVRVSLVEDAH